MFSGGAFLMEQSMKYKVTIRWGKIVLPRPTGRWITDPDGWSWAEHTDGYTLLPDGTKTDFYKYEPLVRVRQESPKPTLLRRLLRRWRRK
jgi:hypothetical protein